MAVTLTDPLLPWLRTIRTALDEKSRRADLNKLLSECIGSFKDNDQYRNDFRFLKIWFLYMDGKEDFESVFNEMMERGICSDSGLLYEWYAWFLELKEKWKEAHLVYQNGILRKAQPLESLKSAHTLFLKRMSDRVNACSLTKVNGRESAELKKSYVNPWSSSTINELLEKINAQMTKYDGYHSSNKAYAGKVPLSSLRNSSRNKIIDIGKKKYQIKGCAGQGGFALVFKATENNNPDDIFALKIQTPAFPWEFHMYRILDQRISDKHRSNFGFAHRIHLYSDYSILVCDYLSHGTLQDVINSYVVPGKFMEEVLCMYYTIELLFMLETLHDAGIIHGDFKSDNLLLRYSRDDLAEDGFRDRSGPWNDEGLCLVDWGRGIDLHLFPDDIQFEGDSRTSGFRCIEMLEKRPWKFQVDTYGLCVIVHMMLHNSYMEVEKKKTPDGYIYLPKSPFKRYWNVELWKSLFTRLLNSNTSDDKNLLRNLRGSFQDHLCSNPKLLNNLKDTLTKQRQSLFSA